jgi:hypothetical protein
MRRFLKTPSNQSITDDLLIDYINRFWIMDIDARIQVFDLKKTYTFETSPGVDRYNMPLYDPQIENPTTNPSTIGMYPVYQGFLEPALANGYRMAFNTQRDLFNNAWPPWVQQPLVVGVGDGSVGPYTLQIPIAPGNSTTIPINPPIQCLLRGHVDMQGIIATGNNVDPPLGTSLNLNIPITSISPAVYFVSSDITGANVIVHDSGTFLNTSLGNDRNYGLLMAPGNAPNSYSELANGGPQATTYTTTQNTINYLTGLATNVYFPSAIPVGVNITAQCSYINCGLPRSVLFYNNVLTLRSPPDRQYLISLDAYMTPAAFLTSSEAIPFAYMSEYIALGAARKIMYDTQNDEMFRFYEPIFREQESLVHIRSQRQWTANRTPTIYNQGINGNQSGYGNQGCNVI